MANMTNKNPNHDELFAALRDFQNGARSLKDTQAKILDIFGGKEENLMGSDEAQLPDALGPVQIFNDLSEADEEENNDGLYPLKEEAPAKAKRGRKAKEDPKGIKAIEDNDPS